MFCEKEHLKKDGFSKILSYINCLNKPLEAETLNLITSVYGPLPELILPRLPLIVRFDSIVFHPSTRHSAEMKY